MSFIDNRRWLGTRYRGVAELVAQYAEIDHEEEFEVETAKSGDPTLKLKIDGKEKYIYSKYSPRKGSERLFKEFKIGTPVLFIGVGLGYQIEAFIEQNPHAKYAIFEPNPALLVEYVKNTNFNQYNANNILNFWAGLDDLAFQLEVLLTKARKKLQIIVLPGYEELYKNEINAIQNRVLDVMKAEKDSLAVDISFQQRWTLNAIKNFPVVAATPNMLSTDMKQKFKGKPAIIVAAGPSLSQEIEHLKHIKENKLAYIFSVGSAINALIKEGIHPDAVLSYDPQAHNYRVIQIIKDELIDTIPLIFGSSVGFETLEDYEGPMLHTLISQDTVAPALLEEGIESVNDAPSIAVVAYQLLSKLQCNPIILVGQNLAYFNDQYYSKGISYETRTTELSENDLEKSEYVEDVLGNEIQTNAGFNNMRKQLEMYIGVNLDVKTINTTYGGAKIAGTSFIRLSRVIETELQTAVVDTNWHESSLFYSRDTILKRLQEMNHSKLQCHKDLLHAFSVLEQIFKKVKMKRMHGIEVLYGAFDKRMDVLINNSFYKAFIEPMIRVQFKQMKEVTQSVRYENDELHKGRLLVTAFEKYFQTVNKYYKHTTVLYEEMKERLESEWGIE